MNILADASLPSLALFFSKPFELIVYENLEDLKASLPKADVLICRATLKVTPSLLQDSKLQCLATASSGVDHINVAYLQQAGIPLMDAKGANAPAVADYVLSCIARLQAQGVDGQKVGVVGVGAVGSLLVSRLLSLGFDVSCYDPLRANREPDFVSCAFEDILNCDWICLHANLHHGPEHASFHLFDEAALAKLKPHAVIINASRGGIVSESALLSTKNPLIYCTDVYESEPTINPAVVQRATLCTPHIAGHSIEAKVDAVRLISQKLHHWFGVPFPPYLSLQKAEASLAVIGESWQSRVLAAYDPSVETIALQQAEDKTQAFLSLRLAHQKRHDFLWVAPSLAHVPGPLAHLPGP